MSGIFGDIAVETIGITGAVGSGKTCFCLAIHPEARDFSKPARTIILDDDGGAKKYQHVYNFDRVDPYSDKQFAGKRGAELWRAFKKFWEAMPAGKYDVAILDTIQFFEESVADYLYENPIGRSTQKQYDRMSGILQGHVKTEIRNTINTLIRPKVQTFAWTAHHRVVFRNERPTSEKRPFGKHTWMEQADVYLDLSRTTPSGAAKVNPVPSAKVIKHRLMSASLEPILPPRFDNATPDRIRQYIQKPANYKSLKKSEQEVAPTPPTAEELLQLELAVAEKKAEAAGSLLETMDRQEEVRKRIQSGKAEKPAKEPATEDTAEPKPEYISADQAASLVELLQQIKQHDDTYGDKFTRVLENKYGAAGGNPTRIKASDFEEIEGKLKARMGSLQGKA